MAALPGYVSWIRIEPCAWHRSLNFGVCLRKSGGCGAYERTKASNSALKDSGSTWARP
jgi:hypothetical protein